MDKVNCLKRLYTKLTGKEITDPDVDTICKVLHLLEDDFNINNVEDVSSQFSIQQYDHSSSPDILNNEIKAKKIGDVYILKIKAKIRFNETYPSNCFYACTITSPETLDLDMTTGQCIIYQGVDPINFGISYFMGDVLVINSDATAMNAGDYDLETTFVFIS